MPRYTYQCPACGHHQESTRTVNARDELTPCPCCGAQMKRSIGSFAIQSSGSPFRPQNLAQQLAGANVVTPQYSSQTSVLRR